jgi:hypothetical protein
MAKPKKPPPWERLSEEGDATYLAFRCYLEQAPPRSIKAVAGLLQRSPSTIYKHSRRYRWQERAEAWDRAQAEVEAEAVLSEKARIVRDRLRLLSKALELGELRLDAVLEEVQTGVGEDARPDLKATTYLIDRALHYERLVLGEATERTETTSDFDVDKLEPEEILEWKRLQKKARKEE